MAKADEPKKTLVQKLSAVMKSVDRVAKRGENTNQNYHYATEADIADAVRTALAEQGVIIVPSVQKQEWRKIQNRSGGETAVANLTVDFTVMDGENEPIKFTMVGEGMDSGDKNVYKAMTGAEKYALLKLFLIPTGDDPEKDEEEPAPKKERAARAAKAKEEPAAPPPTGLADDAAQASVKAASAETWKNLTDIERVARFQDVLESVGGVAELSLLPASKVEPVLYAITGKRRSSTAAAPAETKKKTADEEEF